MLSRPREQRERVRDTLVANIGEQVREVEQQGFDLDAITEAELDEPVRPAPYVDLEALDRSSGGRSCCRPGVSVDSLAAREYQVPAPPG